MDQQVIFQQNFHRRLESRRDSDHITKAGSMIPTRIRREGDHITNVMSGP